jgi:hypothetical protein
VSKPNDWTDRDLPLRKMLDEGVVLTEIAKVLGVGESAVSRRCKLLGLKPRRGRRLGVGYERRHATWTPERVALLVRDWPRNVLFLDITTAINTLPGHPVTARAVQNEAHRRGLRRGAGFCDHNHSEKLDADGRKEVARRYAAGESQPKIAAALGLHVKTIARYQRLLGLKSRGTKIPADTKAAILVRYYAMEPLPAIAASFGINRDSIARLVRKAGSGRRAHVPVEKKPRTQKTPAKRTAIIKHVPKVADVAAILNDAPSVAGPAPRDLTWAECAALAKQYDCWRSTHDFLLSELNPKLIACGKRPVRIRKWAQGTIPPRDLGLDAYA